MRFDNAASHDMPARNRAIHAAHVVHHYTLKEVGDHVRLPYTTVNRMIKENNTECYNERPDSTCFSQITKSETASHAHSRRSFEAAKFAEGS